MAQVLIYTATYGDGPRPETIQSVKGQHFDGGWQYETGWHNPYGDNDLRNVRAQMARAREMALDGGYDALLSVEHDMQIPPDALQRLWDTGAPVAYGAYLFRHGTEVLNLTEKYPGKPRNIGESLSCRRSRLRGALARGPVIEVSGVGFGCTLIRREVLKRVPFREDHGTDLAFAQDCLRAGIRQVADLRVVCGHWDEDHWIRPFAEDEPVTVRALKNVTARGLRGALTMRAGAKYKLPRSTASELQRAGYVEVGA